MQIMTTLPSQFQSILRASSRVILIANNPSIHLPTLSHLLREEDTLVLFNQFIYPDYFAIDRLAKTLPKLLFFRQIGDSKLHFGLPPRHNNLPYIEAMTAQSDIGFIFTNIPYQFPSLDDDPSPNDDPIDATVQLSLSQSLQLKLNSTRCSYILSERHPIVADYPIIEGVHSASPSSGFLMYRYMLAIRQELQLTAQHDLEIILFGFNTDTKTDYFWHGHNWAFERAEMAALPDGVTLIRQE